ncbi:KUP/HAK/KT family potassium transporter [Rhizobium mesoamericanum]|uniref:KUP/HAK/KT family potassium transporter n=1 Tax=Rhizobium mesoamericanum TaxID=1079800 RepID=UPI0022875543|nr:KUP/HAK/KT family potassium transporter [Rhizobium mesoamericanum]
MAIQTIGGVPETVPNHPSSVPALSMAALGVVFGDIGTSPLYTLKTVLEVTGGAQPKPEAILGRNVVDPVDADHRHLAEICHFRTSFR